MQLIKGFNEDDTLFLEENCDWSIAKHWVQWWMRPSHLQMLHKDFSVMDDVVEIQMLWKEKSRFQRESP